MVFERFKKKLQMFKISGSHSRSNASNNVKLAEEFNEDPFKFIQSHRVEFDLEDTFFTRIGFTDKGTNPPVHWFKIKGIEPYRDKHSPEATKIILQRGAKGELGAFQAYWLPMTGREVTKSYTLPKDPDSPHLLLTPMLTGCNVVFAQNKLGQTKAVHQLYEDDETYQLYNDSNPQISHMEVLNQALTDKGANQLVSAKGLISEDYGAEKTFQKTFLVGKYENDQWEFQHQELHVETKFAENSSKLSFVYSVKVELVNMLAVTSEGRLEANKDVEDYQSDTSSSIRLR